MLRGLDTLASDYAVLGFKSATIMLSGDRTAAEAQLKRVNASLRLAYPIVLSVDGAEGPGNYALNRKAALTLVFAKDGKVTKSLALTDTGPNDVPVIRAAIEELCGTLPEDPAELHKLLMASLPDEPAQLKSLVADQRAEIKRLREQVIRLQQRMRGGGQPMRRQPAPARREAPPIRPKAKTPDPNATTELNYPSLTGRDLAEVYFELSGKRMIVSEEAAQVEISLTVPGKLTYAEATKVIEKKVAMEGLMIQQSGGVEGMVNLVVADPSKARPVGGDLPRARRLPAPEEREAPPRPQRQGKPPTDPELNGLLRSFIRQTNDEEKANDVFAKIKARAAKDAVLQEEAVEMFKLMLSFPDRYGTEHAQGLAKSFLKENGPKGE